MKVVINRCYGGFSLSEEALDYTGIDRDAVYDIDRTHPRLIEYIEKFGTERASDTYSHLIVVEIPDDVEYTIEQYDGREWIAEVHRTWP